MKNKIIFNPKNKQYSHSYFKYGLPIDDCGFHTGVVSPKTMISEMVYINTSEHLEEAPIILNAPRYSFLDYSRAANFVSHHLNINKTLIKDFILIKTTVL